MKINDILKKENAGKVYIITNGEWKGEKVTITELPTAEITFNGITFCIEDVVHLGDILDLEFEEEKPYKEISGREALKLMLDGGVVYGDEDFDFAYYIKGNKLVYEDREGCVSNSTLLVYEMLDGEFYIKN